MTEEHKFDSNVGRSSLSVEVYLENVKNSYTTFIRICIPTFYGARVSSSWKSSNVFGDLSNSTSPADVIAPSITAVNALILFPKHCLSFTSIENVSSFIMECSLIGSSASSVELYSFLITTLGGTFKPANSLSTTTTTTCSYQQCGIEKCD